MEENQGLPYPLPNGGTCPECESQRTTLNPDYGHRVCENCGNVWSFNEDDPDYEETELLPVGSCCMCLKSESPTVRNFITVEKLAPVPGTGWGCAVCRLPSDGAVAVVCDECLPKLQAGEELKEVILGFPAYRERFPYTKLEGNFKHTQELHERSGGEL